MIEELNSAITDVHALAKGFVVRNGFIFVLGKKPAVCDTLLIRTPVDAVGPIKNGYSSKSLEEHIELINHYQIEKAKIICRDLSFIIECSPLKEISVYPDDFGADCFDYSPLYSMENLRSVNCRTRYGMNEQHQTSIDYSKLHGIKEISAAGPGHCGYETLPTLEKLWLSSSKKHKNFQSISCSLDLSDVTLMQCSIQSLSGIEKHQALQFLTLCQNRSLSDISSLKSVGNSLRSLVIEGSPKIDDFSVLAYLENLEYLQLLGSNVLPNLSFLNNMPKLRNFTFSMDVEDGNLTLCKKLSYASCKNRKHFNLKDSQLPKQI